jgi:uncharacterized protein with HEPN domain
VTADPRDKAWLLDIIRQINATVATVENLDYEAYSIDLNIRLAIERRFEIIGEAARRLSPETRAMFPSVPWGKVIGLRNHLAHRYDEIDHSLLWSVLKEGLPAMLAGLESDQPELIRDILNPP